VLTDVFGLYNNPKIIADKLSVQLDCDVWVPDYFNGDPILRPERMKAVPPPAGTTNFWLAWLSFALVIMPRLFVYYRNRPSVCHTRLREFIVKLQEEKKYEKIGAVGYCYGGTQAVLIVPTGLVHSIVVCHPGTITLDQVKAINTPSSWALAEEDMIFSDKVRDQAEAIFASRKEKSDYVPYEFVIHKGTTHGFACRPDLSNQTITEAYEKALEQTVSWFKETL